MDPSVTMSKEQANEALNTNACFANHLYSFITSMSLKCAVQLGIADAIDRHGGSPMTISELSTALSIHPLKSPSLHQLMRILTHSGYFKASNDAVCGYSLTPASRLLLEDHPFNVKPYLLFILDPLLVGPWVGLSDWFKHEDEVTPFHFSNGAPLWECLSHRQDLNKLMMGTMAGDSKMLGSILMSNPRALEVFEGVGSMVDVGGGVGEMAKAVSRAFPLIKCVVLDLPHVVEGLQGAPNLSYVAGDMFKEIPSADALLLKWILHDWSDEYCVEILKQCKKAVSSNMDNNEVRRKVIIIDIVIDDGDRNDEEDHKTKETQLYYDMEMMTLVGGKERSKKQWEKLFLDAGFNGGFNIFPFFGFRSLIELFP